MTDTCTNCHYQQQSRCTEPRNQNVGVTMTAGGNYEARLVPPQIELDAVCDFHRVPMRNNYRLIPPPEAKP